MATLALMGLSAQASDTALSSNGWLYRWSAVKSQSDRQAELLALGYSESGFYPLSNTSWVKSLGDTAVKDSRFSANYIYQAFYTPADPPFTNALAADDFAQQYINLPNAWEYNQGSSSILIGVLDSGIDTGHVDLRNKIDTAISFISNDKNPTDKFGHGTAVSSLIGAEGNNNTGIAGACLGCKIVSVKVLNDSGQGSSADIAEGILWAARYGVRIMNFSFGSPFSGLSILNFDDPVQKAAVQYAHDQGILMVAAAGNDGVNAVSYPAKYDQVMGVGAIDPTTGLRASFSNYKDGLDLTAPGTDMFGDSFGVGNILIGSGTSFASPLVAGVAGLLWSEQPTLSRDEVRDRLNSSTKDLLTTGWDEQTGFGSVDAAGALRVAAFRVASGKDVVGFPNPYRASAGGNMTIRPPQDVGAMTVRLYSLDGRLLRTLTGTNEVQWDGKTSGGQTVAAGIYLFQASATNMKDEGRLTVIDW